MKKNLIFLVIFIFGIFFYNQSSEKSANLSLLQIDKMAFASGEDPIDDCEQDGGLVDSDLYDNGLLAYENYNFYCVGENGFCEGGSVYYSYSYDEYNNLEDIDVTDGRGLEYC